MFEHPGFRVYAIDDLPLDCDCFVMDECYMSEYEQSWVRMFNGGKTENPVGYVTSVAVRHISQTAVETSWIPDFFTRFHEVPVLIPRDKIKVCVDCWEYDEVPHMFVDSTWLEGLFTRTHSVFGYVDAIGVKNAIAAGTLTTESLGRLRDALDELSAAHPDVLFLTFGDSLLLKSNWTIGYFPKKQRNTYRPEALILLLGDLQTIYQRILQMGIYAIFTQGGNEFYGASLYHASASGNHICLNSLGLPYAHLFDIDKAVREAIRTERHAKYDLYLDVPFFASLKKRFDFGRAQCPSFPYRRTMLQKDGEYVAVNWQQLMDNIEDKGN